jgi:hypothetical protein
MGGDYPYVDALAFALDGSLYAGGQFTTAGGVVTNRIARWDGSQWHPLGSGMNSGVSALVFGLDRSLYVGGDFTTAGDMVSSRIAQWTAEVLQAPAAWFPVVYIDQ